MEKKEGCGNGGTIAKREGGRKEGSKDGRKERVKEGGDE